MIAADILALPSMPMAAPSPEPLQPDGSNRVLYEFIGMPDSSGFGNYAESGEVIPARFGDQPVNFTARMYLDDHAPT